MNLDKITSYLDTELGIPQFEDFPAAHNGLQVANNGEVAKIAASVDACEATIRGAVERGADLLLVHHGLFWGGGVPVTGPMYRMAVSFQAWEPVTFGCITGARTVTT